MKCTECEIIRAKFLAYLWLVSGDSEIEIAKKLSEKYNEHYYVEKRSIFRAIKTPPYQARLIL